MNEPLPGEALSEEGELITLYYESRKGYTSKSLLALKTFSLSAAMAEYYAISAKRQKLLFTEPALDKFSEWLAEQGYARPITTKFLKIGQAGQLPVRFEEEYKYSINPNEFLIDRITKYFETYSISFISRCHQYVILVDRHAADDEISVDVYREDEYLGRVRFGIYAEDKRSLVIYDEDREIVKLKLLEMIEENMPGANVVLGDVHYHPAPVANVVKKDHVQESTNC